MPLGLFLFLPAGAVVPRFRRGDAQARDGHAARRRAHLRVGPEMSDEDDLVHGSSHGNVLRSARILQSLRFERHAESGSVHLGHHRVDRGLPAGWRPARRDDRPVPRRLGALGRFLYGIAPPEHVPGDRGVGGLPGAFVPMAKKVERERPGEEGIYAGRMLVLLVCVLVGIVALGIIFAGPIVALFANGFKATPGKFELTVQLTRWMFPYVLLVSVAALLEAFLNSKGFFQLSAATPLAWNLSIVAAAWALAPAGVSPVAALTVGVLIGGGLQVALQGPAVRRLGLRFSGSPFRDAEVKRTAIQIAPRLYGYGVGQL